MPLEKTFSLVWNLAVYFPACCGAILWVSANAQERTEPDWWDVAQATVVNISEHGKWSLYLSGYAWHNRARHSERSLSKLNEKAWGVGIGKTARNEDGNEHSLYLLPLRDSHRRIQWTAGYAYQWNFPITDSRFEAGLGFTAALMRRADRFNGRPFPALLPVVSIGTRDAKLMGTYVPRISTTKGKGDVLLIFLKISF